MTTVGVLRVVGVTVGPMVVVMTALANLIEARANAIPEVGARTIHTSSGDTRTWYYHEPCDDGCEIYEQGEGFMRCTLEQGITFELTCQTCGYNVEMV